MKKDHKTEEKSIKKNGEKRRKYFVVFLTSKRAATPSSIQSRYAPALQGNFVKKSLVSGDVQSINNFFEEKKMEQRKVLLNAVRRLS